MARKHTAALQGPRPLLSPSSVDSSLFIAWEALATVFACLPALGTVAYAGECGYEGSRPSFAGAWRYVSHLLSLRGKAIRQTARMLGGNAQRSPLSVTLLTWCIWGLLLVVGANLIFVGVISALAIPGAPVALALGRKKRREKDSN